MSLQYFITSTFSYMYIKFVFARYKHLKSAVGTMQTLNGVLHIK